MKVIQPLLQCVVVVSLQALIDSGVKRLKVMTHVKFLHDQVGAARIAVTAAVPNV